MNIILLDVNLKNEGYDFSQKSQMDIIIVCKKMDMTYET